MKAKKLPLIITSNLFIFLPIIAAAYAREWIFFGFSVFLFFVSFGFHYTYHFNRKGFSLTRFLFGNKKYKSEIFLRVGDWTLSIIGGLYLLNYIYLSEKSFYLKTVFLASFFVLLSVFVYTLVYGKYYDKFHPWWHALGSILIALVVLVFR